MAYEKPKFSFIKNWGYALEGLWEVTRHEVAFRVQLAAFLLFQVIAWFLPIPLGYKAVLGLSLFIPLLAELANSAIERAVDLVTREYHDLAKFAKDAGSALVFLSILFTALIWIFTLLFSFEIL